MKGQNLAELHVHLGGAVKPDILWSLAHEQGIRLPTKDYWEFVAKFTIGAGKIAWEAFHELFGWTELVQSSPLAMERCVEEVIGGAYRRCRITLLELSYNPMFRNRGGERDLDHIIMASLRGLDKARLAYPQIKAGLIFLLDRRLPVAKNQIIVRKAIKYKNRGVVGVDLAGPQPQDRRFTYRELVECYRLARQEGLGTVVHCGEEGEASEMLEVIEWLKPSRIVHGIKAYTQPKILKLLAKRKIVLALCPTANLKLGIVKNLGELKLAFQAFKRYRVPFCLNTDDPEFFGTNLLGEFRLLLKNKILSEKEILAANQRAFRHSFLNDLKGGEK